MLKGGVIMDVTNSKQAKIAEKAGACAVMALERIPSDIRADGGVSRMSDPKMIMEIQDSVSIPVMAKCGFWLKLIAIGVIVILLYFIILPFLGVGDGIPDWM